MRSREKLAILVAVGTMASSSALRAQPLGGRSDDCPDLLRDVTLTVAPSTGGATIDFTTDDRHDVARLRALIREVSATLEYQSKLAALHPDLLEPDTEVIPPVHIVVRDTPNGARAVMHSEDTRDSKRVLVHAQKFQAAWDASGCVTRIDT